MLPTSSPPVVLSLAGSDCSGGAGIQADLKTITALGCYGLTAVTCVVAEAPGLVCSIQPIDPAIVRDQMAVLLKTFPVAAIKTGMLFSTPIIHAVAEVLGNQKQPLPPLIIDPVMIASSGDALLEPDATEAYKKHLFPLASLITPNLDELQVLAGVSKRPSSVHEMQEIGYALLTELGVPLLLKGGHLQQEEATDLLLLPEGEIHIFTAPFTSERETHGTGCTYSAAISAGCAQGLPLPEAVKRAKQYVTQAIEQGYQWGTIGALGAGKG